jgi:hypothetical protein
MAKVEKTWKLIILAEDADYELSPEGDTVVLRRTKVIASSSGEILKPSLREPLKEDENPEDIGLDEYIGLEAVIGIEGVEIFADDQRKDRLVKTTPVVALRKQTITTEQLLTGLEKVSVTSKSPP